jgi:hypothetical protein
VRNINSAAIIGVVDRNATKKLVRAGGPSVGHHQLDVPMRDPFFEVKRLDSFSTL